MGFHSDRMIQEQELGCSLDTDKVVCSKCVEDDALAEVVRTTPAKGPCSFCKKSRAEIGELSAVIERIAISLRLEWAKPEEVPWSNGEYSFGADGYAAEDLLWQIDYQPKVKGLLDDIIAAFGDQIFYERYFTQMKPKERMTLGWSRFKYAIRHKRRFTFWTMGDDASDPSDPDYLPIGGMLKEIGRVIREADLLKIAEKTTGFWRVRVHDADLRLKSKRGLTPPPQSRAVQANRMSPSGVVMFYGADDFKTACIETVDLDRDRARAITAGRFRATRDLLLLDLVSLPPVPSYFDLDKRPKRDAIPFLPGFTKDLAAPISKDGREHVEYVPTQAFTEYVRFRLKGKDKRPIDGIRYPSAHNGRACVVLFCGNKECVTNGKPPTEYAWLSLATGSVRRRKVRDLKFLLKARASKSKKASR